MYTNAKNKPDVPTFETTEPTWLQ